MLLIVGMKVTSPLTFCDFSTGLIFKMVLFLFDLCEAEDVDSVIHVLGLLSPWIGCSPSAFL